MEELKINHRKVWNRIGLSLFVMALVILATDYLIIFLVQKLYPIVLNEPWFPWTRNAFQFVVIGIPVFTLMLMFVPDTVETEKRRIKKLGFLSFLCIFFICAATMYLTNFLGMAISYVITLLTGKTVLNPVELLIEESDLIYIFVYGTLIAPVSEELIFRKLLLEKVRRYGDLVTILVTGLAFGLFHMNLAQFFYASTIGFIFAYITLKTNTIRYSIILHMIINFIGSTLAPLVVTSGNYIYIILVGIWGLTAISLGTTLFFVYRKRIVIDKPQVPLDRKSVIILNPGVILFVLFCVSSMVMYLYQI